MRPQVPDLTSERIIESQARQVFDVLGVFPRYVNHGCLYNQALSDVHSTGAVAPTLH